MGTKPILAAAFPVFSSPVNCLPLPSPVILSTQALPSISRGTTPVSPAPPHPS